MLAALVTLAGLVVGCRAPLRSDREFVLVSWNVHNLFDDRHDGTEFAGYRPDDDRWGTVEFHGKSERTAVGLRHSAGGGYPDIALLQEIENEHALAVMLREYLPRSGYRWFAMPPKSGSAFRVAAVSRFPMRSVRVHALWYLDAAQRDILEVELEVHGRPLSVLVNHWPSRHGGAELTAAARAFAAAAAGHRVRGLQMLDRGAAIVVAGDFNMGMEELDDAWAALGLVNLWQADSFPGSYHFRGAWSRIDHLFLSHGAHSGAFELLSFDAVADELFLDRNGVPRAWFPGSSTGSSDHLPLRTRLRRVE